MLGNLDNEVIFKKAFTDKTVFAAFVRDVLGLELSADEFEIETEKKFEPRIGYIDFELDIFAQTLDRRLCVEIQRIEYDHHFDRFLHYFLMLIAEQQKASKEYGIDRTVYVVVLLTAPYRISQKNGKPVLDEVLLLELNPRTLEGEVRELYGHQFVCLNPNHPSEGTPARIRDWLDLVYQSIHSPERPVLNTRNEGIRKAVELISFDNLTPQERTRAKNREAAKVTLAKAEQHAKRENTLEIARKLIKRKLTNQEIAEDTGLTPEEVEQLRQEE